MSAIKNQLMMCQRLLQRSVVLRKTSVACTTSNSQMSGCVQKCLQHDSQRVAHGASVAPCSVTLLNNHCVTVPSVFTKQFSLSCQKASMSTPLIKGTGNAANEKIVSEMNMRLVNENSFLSWCRNAYLSTVVGVAMITEGTTTLAQGAGIGALIVGTMNLFWGTGCHINNLIKLRNVTGMSGFTLFLNLLGSVVHCLLWAFVLVCYVGFLDETSAFEQTDALEVPTNVALKRHSVVSIGTRD